MTKRKNGGGGCLVVIVAALVLSIGGGCGNSDPVPPAATTAAAATTTQAVASYVPVPIPAAVDPGVVVTRVIDGDTFEIAGGQRVRVLGINSCEIATAGGKEAKEQAETWLGDGARVSLRAQPGSPDKDQWGRLLRYVQTRNGSDFGELMITYEHTGLYRDGDPRYNDASPEYVAKLRAMDTGERICADAPVPAETRYVPLPNGGGDNDKSRFCRRHWYC